MAGPSTLPIRRGLLKVNKRDLVRAGMIRRRRTSTPSGEHVADAFLPPGAHEGIDGHHHASGLPPMHGQDEARLRGARVGLLSVDLLPEIQKSPQSVDYILIGNADPDARCGRTAVKAERSFALEQSSKPVNIVGSEDVPFLLTDTSRVDRQFCDSY